MSEIFQNKSVEFKKKPNSMDQIMDIVRFGELNLRKNEVLKFGQ